MCCIMQSLQDWCLQGVNTAVMGFAQQMGHSESSDGSVMSESNVCLTRKLSIKRRTLSTSTVETWEGTVKGFKNNIVLLHLHCAFP